jgi:ABC-type sugar transport system ATPase subunit
MLDTATLQPAKLALSDLRSGYGAIDVVNSVSLTVRKGEILVLLARMVWARPRCSRPYWA